MARPPQGPRAARKLSGDAALKRRLELILETLAGERSVASAAEAMGVGEAQFHRLRDRALAGALDAIAPRPPGRPRKVEDPRDTRLAELEARTRALEVELHAAEVKAELEAGLQLLAPGSKKGGPLGTRASRRRRPRGKGRRRP